MATQGAADASRQFVTFWLQGEVFGVPLSEVQEIIRMPRIVRVPLADPSLEGIANLRGAVLPIISLRRIFAMADTPHDDATRVVVVNRGGQPGAHSGTSSGGGGLSGFVIDRMASVITTEPRDIEPIETIAGTIRTELLQGMIKREEGTIMLLNLPSLSGRAGAAAGGAAEAGQRDPAGASHAGAAPADTPAAAHADGDDAGGVLQLVSFEVADQEYAFPIEDVQEIVQVPARISVVPRSDLHVIGVMTLRQRLLPLVSLRCMFQLPQGPLGEHNRIVVVSLRGGGNGPSVSVGIVMDAVNEVLRVARSLVEPVPALLVAQSGGSELEAICRLEGGRLVTILSAERMFPAGVRDRLADAAMIEATAGQAATAAQRAGSEPGGDGAGGSGGSGGSNDGASGRGATSDEEQFVVFRLGEEEFGVPIGAVQEIVRVPEQLTRVPKTPDFIGGVVNLRGVVLPVVDQRRRFGLPEMARSDRQRIMVLMVGDVRTGFVVDSVVEVLKVARTTIGPAPHLSDDQRRLIDRVANLEQQKRMLLLMRPEQLLSIEERGEARAVA